MEFSLLKQLKQKLNTSLTGLLNSLLSTLNKLKVPLSPRASRVPHLSLPQTSLLKPQQETSDTKSISLHHLSKTVITSLLELLPTELSQLSAKNGVLQI
jgi:hypothetical protein